MEIIQRNKIKAGVDQPTDRANIVQSAFSNVKQETAEFRNISLSIDKIDKYADWLIVFNLTFQNTNRQTALTLLILELR